MQKAESKSFRTVVALLFGWFVIAFGGCDKTPTPTPTPTPAPTMTIVEAIEAGDIDELQIAIDAGDDVNQRTRLFHDWTTRTGEIETQVYDAEAIHVAIARADIAALRLLLDHGALINAQMSPGSITPLMWASVLCVPEIVEELLSRLDSPQLEVELEHDALHRTALNMRSPERNEGCGRAALLLLEAGADPNAVDRTGSTPLHRAALMGATEIARILLDNGADVNEADNFGGTPLHRAAFSGHVDVTTLLLSRGADIHAVHEQGNAKPIDRARARGHDQVVAVLEAWEAAQPPIAEEGSP